MKLGLIFYFCFITGYIGSQCIQRLPIKEVNEEKYVLFLGDTTFEIKVVEGKSKTYYNLFFNSVDSLLSADSDDIYSDILVSINYNLFSKKYLVVWRTSKGRFIQSCEVDKLKKGSGNYYYNFADSYCRGNLRFGEKEGIEFYTNQYSIGQRSFRKGKGIEEDIKYLEGSNLIVEYYHPLDKSRVKLISYSYEGHILHLNDFQIKTAYTEGVVTLVNMDRTKRLKCEYRSNKIVNEACLYDIDGNLIATFQIK